MPADKSKKKNGSADTSAPSDIIPFEDAVRECKEIRARTEVRNEDTERDYFRIGEIADKVETKYKQGTHAKLAERSNIAYSCLKRYLSVYRAWKGTPFGAPGPQSVSVCYSVLRELAALPDREQIMHDNPKITKREAEQLRRKYQGKVKAKQKQKQNQDQWLRDKQKWFRDLVKAANEATRVAGMVDLDDAEQLDKLLPAVDPGSLKYVRGGGRMLVRVATRLAELLEADADEAAPPIDAHPKATAHAGVA
jgi:hypothetical protein